MDEGHVLVTAFRADEARLGKLLGDLAARGLTVVRGPDIGGYPSYAQEADAAALLIPAGADWPDLKQLPLYRFAREGQLALVNLAVAPRAIPSDSKGVYFDLAGWDGGVTPE